MESTPIYTLRPAEVFEALTTLPDGISSSEVAARLGLYGPNLLAEAAGPSVWVRLWAHLAHPLSGLLWLAGLIALLVREPVLGIVIWILVLVNAGFSYWREHRTEQAMRALRQLLPGYARVIRDGTEQNVPASELAPGDVLILAEGDNIPADARLVDAYGLRTNNAVLTGESVPAMKMADASLREGISEVERPNLVFAGTSIVSGTGRAIVYATGMQTQFGRIARLTGTVRDTSSPLQNELQQLTRQISLIALAIGGVVFVVGALDLQLGVFSAFLLALGIIVATVPEGLPAMITLNLAMAGQRLAQRNVLIKKLAVIETLGTVSTICTDKSGTLTQNQMTVREIWAGGGSWKVKGGGYEPCGEIVPVNGSQAKRSSLDLLLCAAMLCNNARLTPPSKQNPRWLALGDQTEAALQVAALKGGISEETCRHVLPRIHELPFEARRKRMSTIHRITNGCENNEITKLLLQDINSPAAAQEVAFVKGAPREVLEMCTQALQGQEICALSDEVRAIILAQNDTYARRGLRVLALAFRRFPARLGAYTPAKVESELVFLGLMAMLDPARPEVAEAMRICQQAGIRMVMITGDYGLTALSLARRIGMLSGDKVDILTGAELDQLDDEQLRAILDRQIIFARMAPEHKLRLVAAFQEKGEVVAVTGDGVNDAPALRKADVGVAMGITGSDVAKEAADVILVNDNFATIVAAIEEGRAVFDNLRKFMTYIFSSNVTEILPFILTAALNIPLALTVRQILAIDLGTDMLPGLALGTEKPEPGIMQRKPRRRNQPLVDRKLLVRAFFWLGLIETSLAFSGFFLVYALSGNFALLERLPESAAGFGLIGFYPTHLLAITVYHAGVVMAQVGNAFACRSEVNGGRWVGWTNNRFLIWGVGAEIGLIMLLIYVPPLARVFQHAPLPPIFWLWLGLYPFTLYSLEWVRKSFARWQRQYQANSEEL
jgi:Ca2+-transporting ATPase